MKHPTKTIADSQKDIRARRKRNGNVKLFVGRSCQNVFISDPTKVNQTQIKQTIHSFTDEKRDDASVLESGTNLLTGDTFSISDGTIDRGMNESLGVNANMILGLERTLFAALNNAWLLAMGGVGLMSIGNDIVPNNAGVAMLTGSIMLSSLAFVFHFHRVRQIKNGITSNWFLHSNTWGATVYLLTLAVLIMEVYYAKKFPYLDRSWAVKVDGKDSN